MGLLRKFSPRRQEVQRTLLNQLVAYFRFGITLGYYIVVILVKNVEEI